VNEIDAQIKGGLYDGEPIKVIFGHPLQILFRGKDIGDTVVELHIEVSMIGQIVHIKFAEMSPKMLRKKGDSEKTKQEILNQILEQTK